jgi:hypothetical protein
MDGRMRVFLALAALLAGLVLFHFPSREYYYDSADQIESGIRTRAAAFLVDHGRPSGAGVANPPFFPYFMGAATRVTIDPGVITAVTAAVNVAALAALLWQLLAALPAGYGALAGVLLVLAPATVLYPTILWEGAFLIPLAALFWVLAWRFAAKPAGETLLLLTLTATVASQNHQSGFFLFPTLGILAYRARRALGPRPFVVSLAAALPLALPYLHYLVGGQGGRALAHFWGHGWATGLPLALAVVLAAGTPLAIPLLFGFDRRLIGDVFSPLLGPTAWPLLALSLLVTAGFLAGWLAYLFHAARNRTPIDTRAETLVTMPIPFQVAGLATTVTTVAYLAASRYLWIKHLLILIPGPAILAAWPAWRWRHRFSVHLLARAAAASSAICLVIFLWSVKVSGGLPIHGGIQMYGPHYGTIRTAIRDVLKQAGPDRPVDLRFTGTWQAGPATIMLAEAAGRAGEPVPMVLDLWMDRASLRTGWQVIPLGDRVARHARAVLRIAEGVPRGATIGLHPVANWPGFSVGRVPPGPTPWEETRERLRTAGLVVVPVTGGTLPAEATWVLVDTANPALLATQPAAADQASGDLVNRLLLDPEWSLAALEEGVHLFRRGNGGDPGDRRRLEQQGLTFRAAAFTGRPRPGEPRDADGRTVALLAGTVAAPGKLTIRPRLPSIEPGGCRTLFLIRPRGHGGVGTGSLAVGAVVDGREVPLAAWKRFDAGALRAGEPPAPLELPFFLPPGARDLFFEATWDGPEPLQVEEVRLLPGASDR